MLPKRQNACSQLWQNKLFFKKAIIKKAPSRLGRSTCVFNELRILKNQKSFAYEKKESPKEECLKTHENNMSFPLIHLYDETKCKKFNLKIKKNQYFLQHTDYHINKF